MCGERPEHRRCHLGTWQLAWVRECAVRGFIESHSDQIQGVTCDKFTASSSPQVMRRCLLLPPSAQAIFIPI
ncbi:hypothetical protein PR202_ga29102 [Eleusine coracana subsp. coracana]|uniref:Uncharacterized protein n=1 Tax=Eleusine coracana subsp. coracana TaxID=191504 RepID=A0AAV5DK99_ELECO|nr:hypothetical protein PR202_ga29102 [Eleusine coracana subsp. coracana]